jgi:hypothetical protein
VKDRASFVHTCVPVRGPGVLDMTSPQAGS